MVFLLELALQYHYVIFKIRSFRMENTHMDMFSWTALCYKRLLGMTKLGHPLIIAVLLISFFDKCNCKKRILTANKSNKEWRRFVSSTMKEKRNI